MVGWGYGLALAAGAYAVVAWVAKLVLLLWRQLPQIPEPRRQQLQALAVWQEARKAGGWLAGLVDGLCPAPGEVRKHLAQGIIGVLKVAALAARVVVKTGNEVAQTGEKGEGAARRVQGRVAAWGDVEFKLRAGDGSGVPVVAPLDSVTAGNDREAEEVPARAAMVAAEDWVMMQARWAFVAAEIAAEKTEWAAVADARDAGWVAAEYNTFIRQDS